MPNRTEYSLFQSLAGVIITHAAPRSWHQREGLQFQSLAGVIITHAYDRIRLVVANEGFNPSRESSSLTRSVPVLCQTPNRCFNPSRESSSLTRRAGDVKRDLFVVSIPRGSHHHSRTRRLSHASALRPFQSLAGVIITHAKKFEFKERVNVVFQSLAGVIITHASRWWSRSTATSGFNPSRESSSLTPLQRRKGVYCAVQVSIPRGSHHHSRMSA